MALKWRLVQVTSTGKVPYFYIESKSYLFWEWLSLCGWGYVFKDPRDLLSYSWNEYQTCDIALGKEVLAEIKAKHKQLQEIETTYTVID